jgi:hypothetical protein
MHICKDGELVSRGKWLAWIFLKEILIIIIFPTISLPTLY